MLIWHLDNIGCQVKLKQPSVCSTLLQKIQGALPANHFRKGGLKPLLEGLLLYAGLRTWIHAGYQQLFTSLTFAAWKAVPFRAMSFWKRLRWFMGLLTESLRCLHARLVQSTLTSSVAGQQLFFLAILVNLIPACCVKCTLHWNKLYQQVNNWRGRKLNCPLCSLSSLAVTEVCNDKPLLVNK